MNSPHWPVMNNAPNFRETEKIYWCHFVRWIHSLFRAGFTVVAREGLITRMRNRTRCPGKQKGNWHFPFCKLVNQLSSEEVDTRKDGSVQTFERLYGFLSKHFKTSDKSKGEPLLSEQNSFADIKQSTDSKMFVSNSIEDSRSTSLRRTLPPRS